MSIPLTLRTIKGSKLTFNELDSNFLALRSAINSAISSDTFVTGVNYTQSASTLTLTRNDGVNLSTTIISTSGSDTFVTGGTYNPATIELDFVGNGGFNPFSVDVSVLATGSSGDYLPLTGGTMVNGAEINLYNDSGDIAKIFGTNAHSGVSDIEITSDNGLLKVSTDSGIIVDNGIVSHNNSSLVSIQPNGTGFIGNLLVPTITAARTWSLPDENGTIALTTDLNGYISLSGNTSGTCINELWVSNISGCSPVNFGTEVEFNQNVSMGNAAGDTGIALQFFHLDPGDESTIQTDGDYLNIGGHGVKLESGDGVSLSVSDVLSVTGGPTGFEFQTGVGQTFTFSCPTLTGVRSAQFQDSSGTIAYTSDLSNVTGFTYSNNNFIISQSGGLSDLVSNISVMTGLTVNGQTTMSSNGQNILTIIGSGTTEPLFTVQGSSGELFSITDSLTGSLFAVNDISGLPILEVFDDDTIHMGSYQAPSLNTTVKLNPGTGLSTVYSVPVSAYTGAFFDYTVSNTTGARAGNIMSIFSGSTVDFTETSTNDIGSTTDIIFTMSSDGSNASLQVSATTTGWEVKTIVRSI